MVLRNQPDAGAGGGSPAGGAPGGGAPAGAGGGAPAGGAPAGGDPAGGAGAPDPYWRDFLPAHLKADKPEETFGRLADEWKAARDRDASRPQPPKTAAEYAFEPSEKIKGFFKPDDPILSIARDAALEIGLPKDSFGQFVGKIYEVAQEKGLLATPYDAMAEGRKIADRIAPGKSWEEAKPIVAGVVKEMESFAGVVADQLKLGENAKGLLLSLTDEASGVELLQALSGAMGKDPAFKVTGAPASGSQWTKENLDRAVADPRYQPHSPQYDKAYRAEVDAGFRQLYGSEPRG